MCTVSKKISVYFEVLSLSLRSRKKTKYGNKVYSLDSQVVIILRCCTLCVKIKEILGIINFVI